MADKTKGQGKGMYRTAIAISILLMATASYAGDEEGDSGGAVASGGAADSSANTTSVSDARSNLTQGSVQATFAVRDSASSAAGIYTSRCGVGASGQGYGGGAAVAFDSPICDVAMAYSIASERCNQTGDAVVCRQTLDLFQMVVDLGHGAAGKNGWRAKARMYLPSILAWMF